MTIDGQTLFGRPYVGKFEDNSVNATLGVEPRLGDTELTITFEKPVENIEKLVDQLAGVYSTIVNSDAVVEESETMPNVYNIYKSGLEKDVLHINFEGMDLESLSKDNKDDVAKLPYTPVYMLTVSVSGNTCKIGIFSDADPRQRAEEAKHIVYMFGKVFGNKHKPTKNKA